MLTGSVFLRRLFPRRVLHLYFPLPTTMLIAGVLGHPIRSPTGADRVYRHVLCAYPYRRELSDVSFFPPLGLEFIASVIQPYAQGMDIIDLRKEPGRTVDFLRPETDMVCFSVNWDRDADFLRQEILSVPPDIFTLVGGRHATEDPELWLCQCPNVDAVVRGDGEEIAEDICRGTAFEDIPGLSFRRDGRIIHNPNRILGPLRDDLYPNRRSRRYTYQVGFPQITTGVLIDMVSSSRGCPFNCTFCSFNRNPWGEKRNWSARSPESVVDELSQIKAPFVGFTDDLFTHDMDRVERICDLILARGIRKNYLVNARLEVARRPDVLRKMAQAGFLLLMLGIESAHDKTLRSMRKGFGTAQIREYFKVLRKTGMITHGYFILGNIGESLEEMRQILPFARELGLDTIAISTLRVGPHSGLEELVAANPGYHVAPNGKVYSDHCSVQQLKQMRRQMYNEFFTIPQLLQLARKGLRIGQWRILPGLFLRVPQMAFQALLHIHRRKQRRKRKRKNKPTAL